jgi:hypothetical protein
MLDEAGRRQRDEAEQTAADARLLVSWLRTRSMPPTLKDAAQRCPLELRDKQRRERARAWLERRGRLRRELRGHVTVLVLL